MYIRARAPVRVDFTGAWTDVPHFSDAFGGATLNAAINHYVEGVLQAGESAEQAQAQEGGLAVQYESRIPAGSGLGTSATLNVVWLALVRGQPMRNAEDRLQIAELAFEIERILGILGGRQDQYASAVGGINLFEFGAEGVQRHPVQMKPEAQAEFERLLLVVYTGKPRLSSNIHRHVWSNFKAGKRETVEALFTLRDSAWRGKELLEQWQPQEFGDLLTVQFNCMKQLHPSTSNPQMEALFELAQPLVWGGKPCGAGGGGCLLFLARDETCREQLEAKLREQGLAPLEMHLDSEGLTVKIEDPAKESAESGAA